MPSLIYKITNKVNGKVYIGQTTQKLSHRKAEHLCRLAAGERQHKLYRAMLIATLQGRQTHHKGYVLLERFNDQLERA